MSHHTSSNSCTKKPSVYKYILFNITHARNPLTPTLIGSSHLVVYFLNFELNLQKLVEEMGQGWLHWSYEFLVVA